MRDRRVRLNDQRSIRMIAQPRGQAVHQHPRRAKRQSVSTLVRLATGSVEGEGRPDAPRQREKIADSRIEAGTAPPIRCVSECLTPCGHGRGAAAVGYCIADRLGDAWQGDPESGLFFSGSNGGKLKDLVSVRDLIEELTQDPGLQRAH